MKEMPVETFQIIYNKSFLVSLWGSGENVEGERMLFLKTLK